MFRILGFAVTLTLLQLAGPAQAQNAAVERQFQEWLKSDIWPEARKRGVSQKTFNQAFSGVKLNWKLPDLVPPGTKPKPRKRQSQAEFGSPANYFRANTVKGLEAGGRARMKRHAKALAAVERSTGVPARTIVAIWGRESGFGGVKIPHNAFQVLGTKAFMSTRKQMFREELIAALEIVERGHIGAGGMKSSWAGALGQPQFLPTSFLAHAADGNGDGRADIWGSTSDTFASIGNYLRRHGWQTGRDWGFEVIVPANVTCALEGPDQGKPISRWAAMGIERVNGKPFPDHELRGEGYLMMPAGRHGPAFIVTPNFYVLKEYNESDLYALFIGHVGDRIQWGMPTFRTPWKKMATLYRSDIAKMQRALEAKGYDVGGADGLPGFRTRRSIGDWQARNGRAPTCFPDAELVKAVR